MTDVIRKMSAGYKLSKSPKMIGGVIMKKNPRSADL